MTVNVHPISDPPAPEQPGRIAVYQRLTRLPALHPAASRLMALSTEADSALEDFEGIFKTDVSLTADLLLSANSAAYGLRARVTTIRHALTLLGLERVRSLACNISWAAYLRRQPAEILTPVWKHSIATAVIGELLGDFYHLPGMYTAGLLHDLGRLGLFLSDGQTYTQLVREAAGTSAEALDREASLCGMDHCEAGAVLAHTWGFPELMQVTMVEHHGRRQISSGSPVGIIQAACRMADWLGFPEFAASEGPDPELPERVTGAPQLAPERLRELIERQVAALV